MSVPTAATYQVAYPSPPGRSRSSTGAISNGSAAHTSTLMAASHVGMRSG